MTTTATATRIPTPKTSEVPPTSNSPPFKIEAPTETAFGAASIFEIAEAFAILAVVDAASFGASAADCGAKFVPGLMKPSIATPEVSAAVTNGGFSVERYTVVAVNAVTEQVSAFLSKSVLIYFRALILNLVVFFEEVSLQILFCEADNQLKFSLKSEVRRHKNILLQRCLLQTLLNENFLLCSL